MTDQPVILITGASRGIGRALATHYSKQGARVFGCSRSDCDISHENYQHIITDVTDEKSCHALFAEIKKSAKRLDLLINNAGVKTDGLALMATASQADTMMRGNFIGTFLVAREAAKLMKRGRFGRIVNLSSMAVPLGSAGSGLYAASKAAIEQFSYSLARELAVDDITVNTIGITVFEDSDMVKALSAEALSEATDMLLKKSPLKIVEIAHAIDFFASCKAAAVTNQTLYFGGVR